jgi:hypothetical protein
MAPLARRRFDDEDEDLSLYDQQWLARGKKVYRDGCGPRVPLMLMDSAPPPRRAALYDASHHRPRFAEISDDDAANRRAVESYEAHSKWLEDAWRGPAAQPPPDEPDDDDDDESARDRYVREISNAYKQTGGYLWATPRPRMMGPQTTPPVPYGPRRRAGFAGALASPEADAVFRAQTRTAGGGPGPAVPGGEAEMIEAARRGKRPTSDAAALRDARADADAAHAEMVHRLENAWRR